MTKTAALDYAKQNIRVNAIGPGCTETEMITSFKETQPEIYELYSKFNPNGRMAQPSEVADATLFLCSDSAQMINGAILFVDAGVVAGH